MKLVNRLRSVAEEIRIDEKVADVGTDAGYLPLYLLKTGKCPKAIMIDISKDSLKKAEASCKFFCAKGYCAEGDYELRLGSGLEVIEKGEVDVAVFAGMGGKLIRSLLACDPEKTASIKRYIFQPRNKGGELRLWLARNGIKAVRESLVRENRYICEIITAETGFEKRPDIPWSAKFDYPDMLLEGNGFCGNPGMAGKGYSSVRESRESLLREYLEYKLNFEKDIYMNVLKGRKVPGDKIRICKEKIRQLEFLTERLQSRNRAAGSF